jgi:hypothetical protein
MEHQRGVCLDCGLTIDQSADTAGDLSLFDTHSCKPKQERSKEGSVSSGSASVSTESTEPESSSLEDLFEGIMKTIQSKNMKWKPENLDKKVAIISMLRSIANNNTDDDTVDYEATISGSIVALINTFINV